jgi:hypothetical protein
MAEMSGAFSAKLSTMELYITFQDGTDKSKDVIP